MIGSIRDIHEYNIAVPAKARLQFFTLLFLLLCQGTLAAGELPGNRWDLLAVAYPPDRGISVGLGGTAKTLTSRGVCRVKWGKDAASVDIEIKGLPSPDEAGWAGRHYILWAIDKDKRTMNLGVVPVKGKDAKWSVEVPFRIFGLLVTAETNPKGTAPTTAVAMESLLPTDTDLIIPVFRIEVPLTSGKG